MRRCSMWICQRKRKSIKVFEKRQWKLCRFLGKNSKNSVKIKKIDKKARENRRNLLKFVKNHGRIQNNTTGVTF